MESSFLSPPAKRPYAMQDNNNPYNANNGASKRRSKPPPPLVVPSGHVALRLLCHVTKIGGVIGKSGSIVKLFRQETGAKIRIEEPVTACDERVILVVAPETPKKIIVVKGEDKDSGGEEHEVSPAQEAILKLFERVLDVEAETEGIFPPPGGVVSCRMLAETSQVGAVLGKGGKVVEKIRKESGSRIRVLQSDQLPACASPGDEVIQIMGDILAVKKALIAISYCLQNNPPADKGQIVGSRSVGTDPYGSFPDAPVELPHRSSFLPPSLANSVDYASRGDYGPRGDYAPRGDYVSRGDYGPRGEYVSRGDYAPRIDYASKGDYAPRGDYASRGDYAPRGDYASRGRPLPTEVDRISTVEPKNQEEVAFRLLCSNDIVGGVIGKGGSIVRSLQNETGAVISVASSASESEDRIITVSALENPESRFSPAQNAIVRVFARSIEAAIEKGLDASSNNGASVSARLLIQANQVGCLMGKGGTIISEMRKVTGTGIRIISGEQVPKCASENDAVVQIVGEVRNVQDALFNVTSRLRHNLIPNKMPNSTGMGSYSSSTFPEISLYGRAREPTSPGMYPSVGISRKIDRQATLTHSMDHLGLSHSLDRPASPQLWTSQTAVGINSRNMDIGGRGLTTLKGGLDFGSGGKSAIVTNTTVEIVVPEQVIGSVYGENGSNLSRLRQISGAKVVMHDPRPGTSDTVVIISGTPDQTQAAQSLLQAFILSGQSSPDGRSRLL